MRASRSSTETWEAIRSAIHYMDEGDGAEREELIRRAAESSGRSTDHVAEDLEDMERRGEVYKVNGRYRDTNRVLK